MSARSDAAGASSRPGLLDGLQLPHLRRDCAASAPGLRHICAGTAPHLRRDSPHICAGTVQLGPASQDCLETAEIAQRIASFAEGSIKVRKTAPAVIPHFKIRRRRR